MDIFNNQQSSPTALQLLQQILQQYGQQSIKPQGQPDMPQQSALSQQMPQQAQSATSPFGAISNIMGGQQATQQPSFINSLMKLFK